MTILFIARLFSLTNSYVTLFTRCVRVPYIQHVEFKLTTGSNLQRKEQVRPGSCSILLKHGVT